MEWWNEISKSLNPVSGIVAYEQNEIYLEWLKPMGRGRISEFMLPVDEELLSSLPSGLHDQLFTTLMERGVLAHQNDRDVISITMPKTDELVGGLAYVPRVEAMFDSWFDKRPRNMHGSRGSYDGERKYFIPGPLAFHNWRVETEVEDIFTEWNKRSGYAVLQGGVVTWFEGMRQQVALRRGVRCPLWSLMGQCCGQQEMTMKVWRAGKSAGIDPDTWIEPRECAGDGGN